MSGTTDPLPEIRRLMAVCPDGRSTLQEQALWMIEDICANECIGPDRHEKGEHCVACSIYGIAHAMGSCHAGCPVKQEGLKQLEEFIKRHERKGEVKMPGLVIALDGPDGSGKSTTAVLVAQELEERFPGRVICTQQPGATPLGKELRKIVKYGKDLDIDKYTERMLFCADNSSFIRTMLIPALEANKIVVCDRWSFVTDLVYGLASGADIGFMLRLQETLPMFKPDALIIFHCAWAVAKQRKIKLANSTQEQCRIEAKGEAFMENVANTYLSIGNNLGTDIDRMAHDRCKKLYTVNSERAPKDVKDEVMQIVNGLVAEWNHDTVMK